MLFKYHVRLTRC